MYLDSCIFVKLFADEPDSQFFVRSLSGKSLRSSELAHTEMLSALLTRERVGQLSAAGRRSAWREFQARIEAEEIRMEPLNPTVLRKAAQLLEQCHPAAPLRTLDAIHLATADLCQDFPFATTDTRLRAAADLLGFDLFPATGTQTTTI